MVRAHRLHRPYATVGGAPRPPSRPLRKVGQQGPQLWALRGLKVVGGCGRSVIARVMAVAIVCSAMLGFVGVNQMHFWGGRRAALALQALQLGERDSTPEGRWFSFADDERPGIAAARALAQPPSPAHLWPPPPSPGQGGAGAQGQKHGQRRGRKERARMRAAAALGGVSGTGEPRFDSILNLLLEDALEEVSAQTRTRRGQADPFRAPLQKREPPQGPAAPKAHDPKGQRKVGRDQNGGKADKGAPGAQHPAPIEARSQSVGTPQNGEKGQRRGEKGEQPGDGKGPGKVIADGTVDGSRGAAAKGGTESDRSNGGSAEGSGESNPQARTRGSPRPGPSSPTGEDAQGLDENRQPRGGAKAPGNSPGTPSKDAQAMKGLEPSSAHHTEPPRSVKSRLAVNSPFYAHEAVHPSTAGAPARGNASVGQAVQGATGGLKGSSFSVPALCSGQWREQTRRLFASARFSADWRRGVREALSSAAIPGSQGSTIFQTVYRGMDPRMYKKNPQALASDVAASFAGLAGAGVCRGAPLREALSAAAMATGAAPHWAQKGLGAEDPVTAGGKRGNAAGRRSLDEAEANCTSEEVGTSTPSVPLAAYAERGYLWVASVPEQLSKARQHLAEAATMARLANRTLILPRVGSSHVGASQLLPLCVYFDTDRLAQYVPWVTEDFFLCHVRGLGRSGTAPDAILPSLPQRRALGTALLGESGALSTPHPGDEVSLASRRRRRLQGEGGQQPGARAGSRFLCILPPEKDSCAQAMEEVQDPVLLFSTLLLTGGMRPTDAGRGTGGGAGADHPCCVVHHSGHHTAREKGAAAAQEQAREEQGLRALLRGLAPAQLLVVFSRTWFFTLNETVRRAGLQATAYAPHLVRMAAAFVRRLHSGEVAQRTAETSQESKAQEGTGAYVPAASPVGGRRGGPRGFVCVHVRLEFLVREVLKTEPFGPPLREKLLRCSRLAASLAAQKRKDANATHILLAADVSFRDGPPSPALNSSAGAPGIAPRGVQLLSDSFHYNATEAKLAEGYLSEALGVLWGASGSQLGTGEARAVSWGVLDPRHARRDRGVQAALDKLACARAAVFVHGHKWCGGGQSFDREIVELRAAQGLSEHTLAVFGGPVLPPPPLLAQAPSPEPHPQAPVQEQSLLGKGQERKEASRSNPADDKLSTSQQKPSPVAPPPHARAPPNSHALPPEAPKRAAGPPPSPSPTTATTGLAPLSSPALATAAEAGGKPRDSASAHAGPPPPRQAKPPPATAKKAPAATVVAPQPAPSQKAAEQRMPSSGADAPNGHAAKQQASPVAGDAAKKKAEAESKDAALTELQVLSAGAANVPTVDARPSAAGEAAGKQEDRQHQSSGKEGEEGGEGTSEKQRTQAAGEAVPAAPAAQAPSKHSSEGTGGAGNLTAERTGGAGNLTAEGASRWAPAPAPGPLPPPPLPPSSPRRAQALKSVRVRRKPGRSRKHTHRSTDDSAFVDFA